MIQSRRYRIFALAFPIVCLIALATTKSMNRALGTEVTLPIHGYDPRDLLSGHFLIYQIDYGVPELCAIHSSNSSPPSQHKDQFLCLDNRTVSPDRPINCKMLIKGICRYNRFEAGVEKFFVPEDQAQELDQKVRNRQASIVLSVDGTGQAMVKDLLIDGKPWREFVPANP